MKITSRIFFAYWFPLLIWIALIFFLSHQDKDESRKTAEWILQLLNWLHITPELLIQWYIPLIIRKMAHFTEYFLLFFLVFRVMRLYLGEGKNVLFYSWLICVSYAATDEFHQTFIPGRVGQVMDVGVDALGALVAMFISWAKTRGQLLFRRK